MRHATGIKLPIADVVWIGVRGVICAMVAGCMLHLGAARSEPSFVHSFTATEWQTTVYTGWPVVHKQVIVEKSTAEGTAAVGRNGNWSTRVLNGMNAMVAIWGSWLYTSRFRLRLQFTLCTLFSGTVAGLIISLVMLGDPSVFVAPIQDAVWRLQEVELPIVIVISAAYGATFASVVDVCFTPEVFVWRRAARYPSVE